MPDTKRPEDTLRENWVRASRLTLSASVVLFLMSRGQKAVIGDALKWTGVDFSTLNPYAIGLFGVPIVAVLCFWTIWSARAFAQTQLSKRWYERVATKTDLSSVGGKAPTMACWSLFCYLLLPIAALAALEGKFLNGTFYFSTTNQYSCLPNRAHETCLPETDWTAHFWPSHGLQSILDTPYRYEGNLTYLPPWQGILWVALGIGVVVYACFYLRLLLRRS